MPEHCPHCGQATRLDKAEAMRRQAEPTRERNLEIYFQSLCGKTYRELGAAYGISTSRVAGIRDKMEQRYSFGSVLHQLAWIAEDGLFAELAEHCRLTKPRRENHVLVIRRMTARAMSGAYAA